MSTIDERFARLQAKLPPESRSIPYDKVGELPEIEMMAQYRVFGKRFKMLFYWKLLKSQKSLCAICGDELIRKRKSHIDHCHVTGKIRGMLCLSCNIGLGHFRDNQKILEAAWNYLEKFKITNK